MTFNIAYAVGWLGMILRIAGLPEWVWLTLYAPAVIICFVIIEIGLIPTYRAMVQVYLEDWYGH